MMQQDPEEAEAAAEAVLTVQTVEDALEPIAHARHLRIGRQDFGAIGRGRLRAAAR